MAWVHNGKKYWYHNGKRYSRKLKKKKKYYWYDRSGRSHSTDYMGYVEAKASGNRVKQYEYYENNFSSFKKRFDFLEDKKTSSSSLNFDDIDFDEKFRQMEDDYFEF